MTDAEIVAALGRSPAPTAGGVCLLCHGLIGARSLSGNHAVYHDHLPSCPWRQAAERPVDPSVPFLSFVGVNGD